MHKIIIVSLYDSLEAIINCFVLKTLVADRYKIPNPTVHFLVHHE